MKIAAIGDVHGCVDAMNDLIALVVSQHAPDKVVFLGDYVDRGPDSRGVIAKIRELQGNHRFVFLKGNHDDMMFGTVLQGHDRPSWILNGGGVTLAQYPVEADLVDDAALLSKLPAFYEAENHVFVHGGIDVTDVDLAGRDDVLMWYRGLQFKWRGKRVVHGHTPVRSPILTSDEINVDTGCCFGGMLTAAIINDETGDVEFVSVPTPPQGRE